MPSFSSVDWTEDGVGNPIKMHANQRADHRRAQGQDGLRRLRDQRLGGHPPDPGRLGRPRCAPASTPASTCSWSRTAYQAASSTTLHRRGERRPRADEPDRRRGHAASSTKKFELGLFEHPFTDRTQHRRVGSRAAPRASPARRSPKSQVLLKNEQRHAAAGRENADVYVAGSNADNIGNQAGGWTLTWQGGSTNMIPAPRSSTASARLAPQATVTYSKDASAPIGRRDVGVVVVGETPYSEGFGDVGGPRWALRPGRRRRAAAGEEHAAVGRGQGRGRQGVRRGAEVRRAGRLRPAADHRPGAAGARSTRWSRPGCRAARARAWPTCCSATRPFTGKLPVTWPRSARPGADQHRRRRLRPALPVRVRAEDGP